MNQQQYLERFSEQTTKMFEITKAKNDDYSWVGNTDPFKNFKLCEKLWCCKTEQWFVVRMSDKLQRITNLLTQENSVQDEKIEDTLLDLANYSILFLWYLESKKEW